MGFHAPKRCVINSFASVAANIENIFEDSVFVTSNTLGGRVLYIPDMSQIRYFTFGSLTTSAKTRPRGFIDLIFTLGPGDKNPKVTDIIDNDYVALEWIL